MSSLEKIARQYKTGKISKKSYIFRMHKQHLLFWEYLRFIQDKNIEYIEIGQNEIVLRTKTGISLICDPIDKRIIPLEIINFGDYEQSELALIKKMLAKDSIVIDIGANIGWYTINLAKYLQRGGILAFEPMPKTFTYLKKNLHLNGLHNVRLFNYGLSDKEAKLPFKYDPKLSGAASLSYKGKGKTTRIVYGTVRKLDAILPRLARKIDFIKCDVEGAELLVLKGGYNSIRKQLPVIFVEMLRKWAKRFNYHPNDIISLMKSLNYSCFYIFGDQLKRIGEIKETTKATNYFFLHNEKHRALIKGLVKI